MEVGRMRIFNVGAFAVLSAVTLCAQTALDEPAFEAASVKKADPNSTAPPNVCKGGPGTSDPGLNSCTNIALSGLINQAYHIQFYELISPDWVIQGGRDNGYDVNAKIPPGTDRDRCRVMLQKLLAERYHLVVHKETRERPGYVLQLGRRDPKLIHSNAPPPPGPRTTYDMPDGHMRFSMHNSPLSTLLGFLTVPLAASVSDENRS
jgi:uncharacterized protein (TIGR03435 family)